VPATPRVGYSIAHAAPGPLRREPIMSRKYIDCREYPSELNCSVALVADTDDELLEAAVQHATTVHKHADSPELRTQLKGMFHEGTPSVETPARA
jgi:predicted small metal-binding protein